MVMVMMVMVMMAMIKKMLMIKMMIGSRFLEGNLRRIFWEKMNIGVVNHSPRFGPWYIVCPCVVPAMASASKKHWEGLTSCHWMFGFRWNILTALSKQDGRYEEASEQTNSPTVGVPFFLLPLKSDIRSFLGSVFFWKEKTMVALFGFLLNEILVCHSAHFICFPIFFHCFIRVTQQELFLHNCCLGEFFLLWLTRAGTPEPLSLIFRKRTGMADRWTVFRTSTT